MIYRPFSSIIPFLGVNKEVPNLVIPKPKHGGSTFLSAPNLFPTPKCFKSSLQRSSNEHIRSSYFENQSKKSQSQGGVVRERLLLGGNRIQIPN